MGRVPAGVGRGCVVGFMPLDLCMGCLSRLLGACPVCLSISASPTWEAFPPQHLSLCTRPSALGTQDSALRTLHTALCTWHSAFGILHLALPWGVCLQQQTESQELGTPSIPRCPVGCTWGLWQDLQTFPWRVVGPGLEAGSLDSRGCAVGKPPRGRRHKRRQR